MPEINIANDSGRDAVVNMESAKVPVTVRWLDPQQRQVSSVRLLKSTLDHDIDQLIEEAGGIENVAQKLVESDPEVDLEIVGSYLRNTSRVYVDPNREIVHKVTQWEVVRDPSGTERERRPRNLPPQNVSGEIPLQWSGVMIKKEEAIRKVCFRQQNAIVARQWFDVRLSVFHGAGTGKSRQLDVVRRRSKK